MAKRRQPSFSIEFRLGGFGTADVTLRAGRIEHSAMVAFDSDCLGDLARASIDVALNEHTEVITVGKRSRSRLIPFEASVVWPDDCSAWIWTLSRVSKGTVGVSLGETDDYNDHPEPQRMLWTRTLPLRTWIRGYIATLDGVLTRYGLEGYRRAWQVSEFPWTWLVLLKKMAASRTLTLEPPLGMMLPRTSIARDSASLRAVATAATRSGVARAATTSNEELRRQRSLVEATRDMSDTVFDMKKR